MVNFWRAYGLLLTDFAVLAAPAGPILLAWVVLRARRLSGRCAHPAWKAAAEAVAGLGALGALAIVWQPDGTGRWLELVPFRNLSAAGLWQMAGNLLLLAPAGALCRLLKLRPAWGWALGVPLTIEAVQWLAVPGRVASTEDVLLGAVGMTFGLYAAHSLEAPAEPAGTQRGGRGTSWRISRLKRNAGLSSGP